MNLRTRPLVLAVATCSLVVATLFSALPAGAQSQPPASETPPASTDPAPADAAPAAEAPFVAQCKREWTYGATDDKRWEFIQAQFGKRMPRVDVGPWTNGDVDLRATRGEIVVIKFWATWCPTCRNSVPHTNAMVTEFGPQGVRVVGICNTDTRSGPSMAAAVETLGIEFPTAQDQRNQTAGRWGVRFWPYYVVLDRRGVIRGAGLTPSGTRLMVADLLKEQPPGQPAPEQAPAEQAPAP